NYFSFYASSNSPLCSGDTLKLHSTKGKLYNWTGPNGFSSTQQNPTISNATTAMSGNYIVTATDTNGCSARDTVGITVHSLPKVNTSYNQPICIGQTLELQASGGQNYNWTGPNGFSSNKQNPTRNNVLKN